MATLTQTAYFSRKIFKYGFATLVVFIVLKISLGMATDVWRKIHPPPPPPPTLTFSKLPKLVFPEEELGLKEEKLNFKLETIQGGLPKLPNIGKVYFMPQKGPNFLALERANSLAKKMGFIDQPEAINQTTYRWVSTTVPTTRLEMDINTLNFHLFYDYQNDQEIITSKNLPSNEQAAQEAKNFLVANDLLPEDLATGTAEFEYFRFGFPNLTPAVSLSEAELTRVNLFRADLDGLKIFPPNPKKSLISFLLSGSRSAGKRILEINYTYFPIEKEIFATYPLKSVTQAWNELQTGNGYIAHLGQNEEGKITIRQVYLAFYDSFQPQFYLQPIYIFQGDRNFFAYIPAVDPKWME